MHRGTGDVSIDRTFMALLEPIRRLMSAAVSDPKLGDAPFFAELFDLDSVLALAERMVDAPAQE